MKDQVEMTLEEQIRKDRADGMTWPALAEKYKEQGMTVKKVRNICKDVKVVKIASSPQKAIAAVYPLAIRPIGVKPSEYFPILRECYGLVYDEAAGYEKLNITAGQKSYLRSAVKEKARKAGKEAHFIPEWMDRAEPELCNQTMLDCAQNLYDAFEEQVSHFLEMFPELGEGRGNGYSIRNELFSLVVKGYDPSGVHKRCERNLEAMYFLTGNPDLPMTDVKMQKEYEEEKNVHGDTAESIAEWEQTLKDLGY